MKTQKEKWEVLEINVFVFEEEDIISTSKTYELPIDTNQ